MKKYIFIMIVCVAALTGCKTVRKATAVSENIRTEIRQYPTAVDLNIGTKVEKTISWNFALLKFLQPSFETRKQNLIAGILRENGADVLLNVQSIYKEVPFGKRTLTITGYPATYNTFRKATEKDIKAYKTVIQNNKR